MAATRGNLTTGVQAFPVEVNETGEFILADPMAGHRPPQMVAENVSPNFSEREVDSQRETGRGTKITIFTKGIILW